MRHRRALLAVLALVLLTVPLGRAAEGEAAAIPLPEHPRPDFERAEWVNLNGDWSFRFDPTSAGEGERWFDTAPSGFPLAISGGSRKAQLRALAADATSADGPVVIAGDFNSHGKVEELAKAGFAWLTKDLGDTARLRLFGIGLGGLSYDHVLAKGLRLADAAGAIGVVPDNRGASDHKPIWAVLEPDDQPERAGRSDAPSPVP